MAITAFNPNYKSYEFDVIKEDWNEYELKDNTRMKSRMVLTRIIKRDTTPPGQYEINGQPIFVVTTDPSRRKAPTPPLTGDEIQLLNQPGPNELKIPTEVLTSAERWNQYRIIATDEVLRIKLVLIDVFRVPNKYDELGEPLYSCSTGNVIAPMPPHGQIPP